MDTAVSAAVLPTDSTATVVVTAAISAAAGVGVVVIVAVAPAAPDAAVLDTVSINVV